MEDNGNREKVLVLTYNNVDGYPAGLYKGETRDVVVYSQDRRYHQDSPEKLQEIIENLYEEIDFDDISKVIVYSGRYAMRESLDIASALAHSNEDVELVACKCDLNVKKSLARGYGIELVLSECGGVYKMGDIVSELLE